MKDKVLIIGEQGVGKTILAQRLAIAAGYKIVVHTDGIWELKIRASSNTIYVSNTINEREALLSLEDFTIIKLIII